MYLLFKSDFSDLEEEMKKTLPTDREEDELDEYDKYAPLDILI